MNRQLLRLQRYLLTGPDKGCPPFDRYCYNSFSWGAQDLSYRVKTQEEKDLCLWLRDLAVKKSKEMSAKEQEAKRGGAQ